MIPKQLYNEQRYTPLCFPHTGACSLILSVTFVREHWHYNRAMILHVVNGHSVNCLQETSVLVCKELEKLSRLQWQVNSLSALVYTCL